jgi:hypothetical protein
MLVPTPQMLFSWFLVAFFVPAVGRYNAALLAYRKSFDFEV